MHYAGSRGWLRSVVDIIADSCENADAIIIVGDVTNYGDLNHLKEALVLVKGLFIDRPVLVIPGNHDVYVTPGENTDSLRKLELFNEAVETLGCIPLMKKPFILDNIGFVGSIGWYDYSFAPEYLKLSIEDFKTKAFGLTVWADREYVKLPTGDEEFTLMLIDRFEKDIEKIYNAVDRIVAVLHHVPFRQLVEYRQHEIWDYFSTFMGSESFGNTIKKYNDKIKLVVYGHQHGGVVTRICKEIDGIKVCNCASPIPLVLEL